MRIYSAKCGYLSGVAITFGLLVPVADAQMRLGPDWRAETTILASFQPFCTVLEADTPDTAPSRNMCELPIKAGPADTNERKIPIRPKRSVG